MLVGASATMLSLIGLAWAREIVGGFLALFGADPTSKGAKVTTICFAILFVYILDFSINTGTNPGIYGLAVLSDSICSPSSYPRVHRR